MKLSNSHFFVAHPYLKIVIKSTFTLFNLVNIILAAMVALVGSYKNMLFILIALANTLISIVNGIRAQKTVDKLKLLSEKRPVIIRNGTPIEVDPKEVAKGDLLELTLGDQIQFDAVLEQGTIEVNEALLTGEQDNIAKSKGDKLISGSFVVAGAGIAEVTHTIADNFVTKLENEAHTIKTADSKLFTLMNNIVKYISWVLIPIGALLLWSRFRTEADTTVAVTSTVAGLINMIPEGLILLTSSVLALATIRLSKKKVLVQDLYAIETLARVDTICLDKTGTLTTGKMTVHDILTPDGTPIDPKNPASPAEKSALRALAAILSTSTADNATVSALKKELARTPKNILTSDFPEITDIIPFSSDRKYSGIRAGNTEYLIGAIDFLTTDASVIEKVKSYASDYRTIAVVASSRNLLAVIRLEDEIRPSAQKIINYFYKNDIDPKIISGDDIAAVTSIAEKVGIRTPKGINLSDLTHPNYAKLVQEYNIFTRVTPAQKKQLVKALKKQGRTVAMTGDGVNDILAMKEADASLAIGAGADAARRAAKFVLLNSDYDAVPSIIDEGRQSINNLERSTTLFLAKTVYASILAVVFVFLPLSYPFSPIEMSLLNFLCIGFPGLILALEKNTERIKNRFTKNIIEYSAPIGLTVSVVMLALSIISRYNGFSRPELSTISVFVTFTIDLMLIYWISKPLNKLRTTLILTILGIMTAAFLVPFTREFFEFTFLAESPLIVTLILIATSIALFFFLRFLATKLSSRLAHVLHL